MYSVSQVKEILKDGSVRMGCLASACQGCHASMFCNNKDDNEFVALNPSKVEIEEGDYVELYMPPGRTILSTVLVFALPLALFPIGYLVCKAALPAQNEIIHALAGFGAMALAFGISSIITIRHKRRLMPSITRIVGKGGDSEPSTK
ncbi:MAG: SoxR reducing system RseC family protein [Spirochaetales bacterium]|nr:SoxR reducing system RseC family protein [Spirochaetales bacterium]